MIDKRDLQARDLADHRAVPPPAGTMARTSSGTTGDRLTVEYPPGGAWWQGLIALRRRMVLPGGQPWQRQATISVSELP
jgi:hypothetical protein